MRNQHSFSSQKTRSSTTTRMLRRRSRSPVFLAQPFSGCATDNQSIPASSSKTLKHPRIESTRSGMPNCHQTSILPTSAQVMLTTTRASPPTSLATLRLYSDWQFLNKRQCSPLSSTDSLKFPKARSWNSSARLTAARCQRSGGCWTMKSFCQANSKSLTSLIGQFIEHFLPVLRSTSLPTARSA